MMTFYYFNSDEVQRQYALTVSHLVESIEESTVTSGKAGALINLGGWLSMLGLGDVEASGELERESARKVLRSLRDEQKLVLMLKDLRKAERLKILDGSNASGLVDGQPVAFEGYFQLQEHGEEGVSRFEGKIQDTRVNVMFSERFVPLSVLAFLRRIPDDVSLSGYGTVMKTKGEDLNIRPVAFGQGILDGLKPA